MQWDVTKVAGWQNRKAARLLLLNCSQNPIHKRQIMKAVQHKGCLLLYGTLNERKYFIVNLSSSVSCFYNVFYYKHVRTYYFFMTMMT